MPSTGEAQRAPVRRTNRCFASLAIIAGVGILAVSCVTPGADRAGAAPDTQREESQAVTEAVSSEGVRVNWVRQVYSDAQWSGWPDITEWRGTYYICFANGSAHGARDHRILLTSSRDLQHWTAPQVLFGPPGDHLESFFLKADNKLYVHASWRDDAPGVPVHTDFVATEDGKTWQQPRQAYLDRYIFWGQSKSAGRYYVAAHIDAPVCTNYLLASDDADTWREVAVISDDRVTETALCFLDSGELMAFSRRHPRDFGLASFASPPYTEWRHVNTDTVIEGAGLAQIGRRIVAIGRCSQYEGQESIERWYDSSRRTGVFFYEDSALTRQALLPSGGDTGYAGIVPLDHGNALVVYYSEHASMDAPDFRYKHCGAIYLASITVQS